MVLTRVKGVLEGWRKGSRWRFIEEVPYHSIDVSVSHIGVVVARTIHKGDHYRLSSSRVIQGDIIVVNRRITLEIVVHDGATLPWCISCEVIQKLFLRWSTFSDLRWYYGSLTELFPTPVSPMSLQTEVRVCISQ